MTFKLIIHHLNTAYKPENMDREHAIGPLITDHKHSEERGK